MSEDQKPIATIMEEGANIILSLMRLDNVSSNDKIKAFACLTEYYLAAQKKGKGVDKSDTPNFNELRDQIRSAEDSNGAAADPASVQGH